MAPITPYSGALAGREPIQAMREAASRIEAITAGWSPQDYERSYAPGKWSARLILTHLAQSELAFGFRARTALALPGYTSTNFDQDAWLGHEGAHDGETVRAAFAALSRMNQSFFGALSPGQRDVVLTHPEYGPISVDWILHQMAGHACHHLAQFETIARG